MISYMISYMNSYFKYQFLACCSLQARFVNDAVDAARAGSVFYRLEPIDLDFQPCRPLLQGRRPSSASRYRLMICVSDIIHDIIKFYMISHFAIYDIRMWYHIRYHTMWYILLGGIWEHWGSALEAPTCLAFIKCVYYINDGGIV
jgi:hypothetical protein